MKISFNSILWFLFAMFLGAALFFTISVEQFKRGLNISSDDINFSSGQKVTVVKIIDGDEISVKLANAQFIVRIFGISSFEPEVNDPVIENISKESFRYLEKTILNNEVELVFEKFQKDKEKRVLSYVYYKGIDVGLDMIANGYSIVYTRYIFPRMDEYLKAEKKSIETRKGLWGQSIAAKRSMQLKKLWDTERSN